MPCNVKGAFHQHLLSMYSLNFVSYNNTIVCLITYWVIRYCTLLFSLLFVLYRNGTTRVWVGVLYTASTPLSSFLYGKILRRQHLYTINWSLLEGLYLPQPAALLHSALIWEMERWRGKERGWKGVGWREWIQAQNVELSSGIVQHCIYMALFLQFAMPATIMLYRRWGNVSTVLQQVSLSVAVYVMWTVYLMVDCRLLNYNCFYCDNICTFILV